ncbi:MAG TPA: fused MFS/spermidine synthase [Vicinamibacterales bacterium]|nr:fused MFS/spermidine synthase [Vicinamibacterales bacterium]
MPFLFAAALFLNAFLLFWVQPLFAKMVLPLLGGSPSVWTTCMLFFQAALLAGYAYSHAGIRVLGIRRQALLHGVIVWLPLLLLPVTVNQAGSPPEGQPIWWLLQTMGTSIGLPFIAIASTAPLLQRWFGSTGNTSSADPYWLYAASNAGSLIALLAFPILLEPTIPIGQQQTMWKIGYGLVAALLTSCALVTYRRAASEPALSPVATAEAGTDTPPTIAVRARWLALSFAPSCLMLGVTTYLSTDVAAVPLLWVLPLAVYLLTFIVAFGWYSDTMHARTLRMLPRVLLPVVLLILSELPLPLWVAIPVHVVAFGVLALLCHGELARNRPTVRYLTEFYLWLATGGVLGGVFNTLIAPRIFTSVAEYPLAIGIACLLCVTPGQVREALANPRTLLRPAFAAGLAAALLIGGRLGGFARLSTMAALGLPALVVLGVRRDAGRFGLAIAGLLAAFALGNAVVPRGGGRILLADRTFFGVYRVRTDPGGRFVSFVHGTTTHGRQVIGATSPEPLTYYHHTSPVGQVFATRGDRAQSVGVVGLGAGTLAAYANPGATWTFYEIDGAVERIARDTRYFRYLDRCGAQCTVVLGDARLSLARSQTVHDILVLDAFSSDAIPIHLLTTEALGVYESHLAPDGLLVVHISNRHFRLPPVLARLAQARGLTAMVRSDPYVDAEHGYEASDWVVMTRRPEELSQLARDTRWTRLTADSRPAWSDDFSNVWTELR